ncbi:ubiquinol-cytochrome c reductase ubiquinone-binding protein [Megalopta genalis]|uniref:ubiquinol-cytochrome c reductase ubiquinone-binding protein n=1 Tax=Megalopta genalis TaxID=115081 RepID=UPI003FD3AC63
MGRHWGSIARITGITTFRLSPYEQKPFVGLVKDGFPNLLRRFREQAIRVLPCFLAADIIMKWATRANFLMHRKDPNDYVNDV